MKRARESVIGRGDDIVSCIWGDAENVEIRHRTRLLALLDRSQADCRRRTSDSPWHPRQKTLTHDADGVGGRVAVMQLREAP
jgi:hypothetical protein